MPNYGSVIQISRTLDVPSGFTVDGTPVAAPTFAVKRSNNTDISGRPGLIVELLVDGSPPDKTATVAGRLAAGTAVRVGNTTHELQEALDFKGGDFELGDYWYRADTFGRTSVEPVIEEEDQAAVRATLRRHACIDVANAFLIAAPSNAKGRTRSRRQLTIQGAIFDAAFQPAMRLGVPQNAASRSDGDTRQTVGVGIPRFAPFSGSIPIGWSDASTPFFPSSVNQTITNFATVGYSLDPGVAVAVFTDALTENWADGTAVSFLTTEAADHWAEPIDDAISQRLVADDDATAVEEVQAAAWEIALPGEPSGELIRDEYGRVWTVQGFEAIGNGRWRVEATRNIGGDVA